jgi:DNA-directed RNA polymerase subunit RPC12/RpoP
MAVAKLLCGECGAPLAPGDTHCGACGAGVELPSARATPARAEKEVRCPTCGHKNPPESTICASCGARLGPASPGPSLSPKPKQGGNRPAPPTRRRFEPWQLISGAAALILVAYLVSIALKDTGSKQTIGSLSPAPMPPPAALQETRVDSAPLEAAVRQNPGDLGALLRLANALHDNGEYARAIETYATYLAKDPGNPDARVDQGICYFELAKGGQNPADNYKHALGEMQRVIKKNPNHQPAAFNLGIVYRNMGDIKKSNTWFQKAVQINKESDLGHRAQSILSQHSFTP